MYDITQTIPSDEITIYLKIRITSPNTFPFKIQYTLCMKDLIKSPNVNNKNPLIFYNRTEAIIEFNRYYTQLFSDKYSVNVLSALTRIRLTAGNQNVITILPLNVNLAELKELEVFLGAFISEGLILQIDNPVGIIKHLLTKNYRSYLRLDCAKRLISSIKDENDATNLKMNHFYLKLKES